MTAVRQDAATGMSIGTVLDRLRPDFPDVTISKIRFLEAEGLISPERTPSGYRRFSIADCERLRYVLTAQRDQYLPLKVIKEQLEAIDKGAATVGAVDSAPRRPRPLAVAPGEVSPEEFRSDREVRISRDDLIERSGIDVKFLNELLRSGLVVPEPPASSTRMRSSWRGLRRRCPSSGSRCDICGPSSSPPTVKQASSPRSPVRSRRDAMQVRAIARRRWSANSRRCH